MQSNQKQIDRSIGDRRSIDSNKSLQKEAILKNKKKHSFETMSSFCPRCPHCRAQQDWKSIQTLETISETADPSDEMVDLDLHDSETPTFAPVVGVPHSNNQKPILKHQKPFWNLEPATKELLRAPQSMPSILTTKNKFEERRDRIFKVRSQLAKPSSPPPLPPPPNEDEQ